jgi:mRNA-degrading endonuclease RelE of RelBE toxin-antitoxin system
MVDIFFDDNFESALAQIKNQLTKTKIRKQIEKLRKNPRVGKPMRYERKGTRELYIKPFRLSYAYLPSMNRIVLLDLYHKKKQ